MWLYPESHIMKMPKVFKDKRTVKSSKRRVNIHIHAKRKQEVTNILIIRRKVAVKF
jgi:hypothetical protein